MEVDYIRVYQKGAVPKIVGDNLIDSSAQNLEFKVYGTDSYTYNWTVSIGAEIVNGQGTGTIHVNWGNNAGNVTCALTAACGEYNLEFPVQIDSHSEIKQNVAETINIYPTLANNLLFVKNIQQGQPFIIFNCLGETEIKGIIEPGAEIDISNLNSGSYFVQFPNKGTFLPARFLKIDTN
jgi:hypothetical protein